MTKYVVKSNAITVLKLTSVMKVKDSEMYKNTPEAWQQGKYTNIVVTKGMNLDTDTYEPNRLHQLYINGMLELEEGESTPSEEYRAADPELLDEAINTTESKRGMKVKGKGKDAVVEEVAE